MERKLPTRKINGTPFIVDIFREEIRELNYPENRILFREMLCEDDGLSFQFDPRIRNVPDPAWADAPDIIKIHLPAMELLDPAGMERKQLDQTVRRLLSPEQVRSEKETVYSTEQGIAHQIVFLGNTPYEIYPLHKQLRPFGGFGPIIELFGMPIIENAYYFVYNKSAKAVEQSPIPEHLADYEQIYLPLPAVGIKTPLDKETVEAMNDLSRSEVWGIYFADDYMLGYLRGRPVELEFGGEPFTLDVDRELYFQSNNPENTIRLSDLPCSNMGYELSYDPALKNIASQPGDGVSFHFLDQMVCYDPLGMARKHNISIGRLPEFDNDLKHPGVIKQCQEFKGTIPNSNSAKQKKDKPKRKPRRIKR